MCETCAQKLVTEQFILAHFIIATYIEIKKYVVLFIFYLYYCLDVDAKKKQQQQQHHNILFDIVVVYVSILSIEFCETNRVYHLIIKKMILSRKHVVTQKL